jgi:protein FRG1
MVKPLSFKGDKKAKKRKHRDDDDYSSTRPRPSLTDNAPAPAPAAEDSEADTWVSADAPTDLNGPIIIVLPSAPIPTCIASDANGVVFASALENTIDNDARTAEPHDVRQVWVATRVAGTEGFSFKGHHGRYLSCDRYGILSATAAAISPFESFVAIQPPDAPGMLAFQTQGGEGAADTFLTMREKTAKKGSEGEEEEEGKNKQIEIRGDASAVTFESTLRVRMQARFKPKIRASKETKAREKISRKELEATVGRRLEEHEVKRLKKARREGNYYEEILDVRVKGKHDKYS